MKFSPILITAGLAIAEISLVSGAVTNADHHVSLQWRRCDNATDPLDPTGDPIPVLCSTLPVPLDYTDENCQTTYPLQLRKIEARNQASRRETVIANYGGPGNQGIVAFESFGPLQRLYIGSDRDIMTWLPRGTEGDLLFNCHTNATNQPPEPLGNASSTALSELWDDGKALSDLCLKAQRAGGSLIGTAFTARDMMQIVDALDEDGLLRYYGISYGTILGATAAALFPDRIERLLVDGNLDSQRYYHEYALREFESADDVFLGFCEGCISNPKLCPLASSKDHQSEPMTASQLCESLYTFVENLKTSPLTLPATTPNGTVDVSFTYSILKVFIYTALYSPSGWHNASLALDGILHHDATVLYSQTESQVASNNAYNSYQALQGIKCSDTYPRASSLEEVIPYIERLHNTSRIGGDQDDGFVITSCARWAFAAKERPTSDFSGIKTRSPALVLSNRYDAVTPLQAAKNASEGLLGSALLVQNGYGHTTTTQVSLCTAKIVNAYFVNGTLPKPGTTCEVDDQLFNETSFAEASANVVRYFK